MKKVLIASAALFFAALTNVNAQTAPTTQSTADKKDVATAPAATVATTQAAVEKKETAVMAQPAQPAKTPVKTEALPESVKATLTGADFKGWNVSAAFLVKATTEYYEVVLTKEKETKTVKLDKDGKLI